MKGAASRQTFEKLYLRLQKLYKICTLKNLQNHHQKCEKDGHCMYYNLAKRAHDARRDVSQCMGEPLLNPRGGGAPVLPLISLLRFLDSHLKIL